MTRALRMISTRKIISTIKLAISNTMSTFWEKNPVLTSSENREYRVSMVIKIWYLRLNRKKRYLPNSRWDMPLHK